MRMQEHFGQFDRIEVPDDLRARVDERVSEYREDRSPVYPIRFKQHSRRPAVVVGLIAGLLAAGLAFAMLPGSDSGNDLAGAVELVCDDGGVRVETGEVAAQDDGVHLHVRSKQASGGGLLISFGGGAFGRNLEGDGFTVLVESIPPGEAQVACIASEDASRSRWSVIGVLDPERFYVSPDLECSGAVATLGARSYSGEDPMQVASSVFRTVMDPDDSAVEPAGYPAASPRLARLVAGGRVVGVSTLHRDDGVWISDEAFVCEELLE
jgi:hypothetical protein